MIRGYCAAVRSAPDRRRPAAAGGLGAEAARPAGRRSPTSLDRVAEKGGCPTELTRLKGLIDRGPGGDGGAVAADPRGLRLGASGGPRSWAHDGGSAARRSGGSWAGCSGR